MNPPPERSEAMARVRERFPKAVAQQDQQGWYVRAINADGHLYGFLGRAQTESEAWIQAARLLVMLTDEKSPPGRVNVTLSSKETQTLLGAEDPIQVVRCPYCGELTLANQVEQPVDYCHHTVIRDPLGVPGSDAPYLSDYDK
jgi:hypothetical protein